VRGLIMLELVPEQIDGAVICNVIENPNKPVLGKDHSVDMALALYNWIKQHDMHYVILDLQDEKEVCTAFLAEIMQLRKRLPIPFVFAGVMEKPMEFLSDYDYTKDFPTFTTPEDAVRALRMQYPGVTEQGGRGITYGKTISEPNIKESSEELEAAE
jgi:hypothetical protein